MTLGAQDRATFFDVEDFGTPAQYIPTGGQPWPLVGIFTEAHGVAAQGIGAGVSVGLPVLTIDIAALPADAQPQGDSVVIGDDRYRVADRQPDRTGLARLILEKE